MYVEAEGEAATVNSSTDGSQFNGDVITLADGGYIVLWYDDARPSGEARLFRRYDAGGSPVGPEQQLADANSGIYAARAGGGFYAAWSASDGTIRVQAYTSAGVPDGDQQVVHAPPPNPQVESWPRLSSIVATADGFALGWTEQLIYQGQPLQAFAPAFQSFLAEGTPAGDRVLLSPYSSTEGGSVELVSVGSGGIAVTWGLNGQLLTQAYDDANQPLGTPRTLNQASDFGFPAEPHVVSLADGGYVVVWDLINVFSGFVGLYGLRAQTFDAAGQPTGAIATFPGSAPAQVASFDVSALPTGGFVMTWAERTGTGSETEIVAQLYDPLGVNIGDPFVVGPTGHHTPIQPRIATDAEGHIVVTWTGDEIMSQRFDLAIANGTASDDTLHADGSPQALLGGDGDDVLIGDAGDDILDGGAGDDRMAGGGGDDFYRVDSSGDAVTEQSGAGIDAVSSTVTFRLDANIENLTLAGVAAIDATGNALANALVGNDAANRMAGLRGADVIRGGRGDDRLAGGGGADTLAGGEGDDRLFGGDGADLLDGGIGSDLLAGGDGDDRFVYRGGGALRILEHRNGGFDTVESAASYKLDANVEELILTSGFAHGTGNASANRLEGSSYDNVLAGRGGDDRLLGDDGGDVLVGGDGRDVLIGGTGADTFRFARGEFATDAAHADLIKDFSHDDGDRIDLHRIDADSSTPRHEAFDFIGRAGFSGEAGELRYDDAGGKTLLLCDRDGDSTADLMIILDGRHQIVAADLIGLVPDPSLAP